MTWRFPFLPSRLWPKAANGPVVLLLHGWGGHAGQLLALASALREHGLTIPDDVSIIGFDNLPQSATMDPGLTTIEVSKRKIGYLAVTILDDLINSTEPQPAVKIQVGADLVLRGSHEKLMQRSKTRAAKQQIPAQ